MSYTAPSVGVHVSDDRLYYVLIAHGTMATWMSPSLAQNLARQIIVTADVCQRSNAETTGGPSDDLTDGAGI